MTQMMTYIIIPSKRKKRSISGKKFNFNILSDQNMENAFTGYVEIGLDEMVKCVTEPTQTTKGITIWIETESDKLSLPHTLTASEKRKFHFYYMTLLKSITTN